MKQHLINNRIKVLLLAIVLLFAGLCYCAQSAYAHYENEVGQQVIYGNSEGTYEWRFLNNTSEISPTQSMIPMEETVVAEIDNTIVLLQYPSEDRVALLEITLPEGCDRAVLGYNGNIFPSGTVYSVDGKQGYSLNGTGTIAMNAEQSPGILIQIPENGTIDAYYYSGDVLQHKDSVFVEILTNADGSWKATLQESEPVIGGQESLTWSLLGGSTEATYEVEVFYLLKEGYADVNAVTGGYPLTIAQDINSKTITVSNDETQNALAGTYRMGITYNYKLSDAQTISMQTLEIPFFVNYR